MDTYHAQLQSAEFASSMMKLGCYLFMAIVGLIGFMNMANTIIMNITTKKQEYGILQAVGMTNKQLNLCLQLQGMMFTVGTICVALIIGLPLGYALFFYAKHNGIFGMKWIGEVLMADKIGTDEYGEILIYQTDDGQTNIEVKIEDDTVWLTQQQLTELYQCSKSNISEHIKHIFEEGELDKDSVVRKFRTTADDGKTYNVTYYNLDMIISLGYRIKSVIATRFRQWATKRLKEYMIKGFTIDDERLKGNGGGNYWKELLDRIRDIRSSEKVLYRQVLDLYATSVDYNPHSEESVRFFKIVQNKLHYAAHGHTAAEVIYQRADAEKPFMGLTSFSGELPALKRFPRK